MPTAADHLRKQIGVVIDLVCHLATDVEKDFQKFRAPVHRVDS